MDTLKICGAAVIASFAALILRELRRDTEIPLKLTATVLLLGAAAAMAIPLIASLREGAGAAALGDSLEIIVRALAVALAVKMSSDICRECGAPEVASALELTGRIEVLLLSLPLFRRALELVGELAGA